MSDNDPTRSAPPDGAATRSLPPAPLPSTGGTISHVPALPGASATLSVAGGPHAVSGDAPEVPGYELTEELGRGAMGVVFKARNLRLNRTVALKMVLGDHRADPRRLIRFLAEAEAVAAVKHPHVVQVFEFGDASGRPFIAFEYLAGGKLTPKLGSPLPPKEAAELLSQIARGVAAAHDQGIVHRDLKPGNVLFDEAGVPKVTDFGLAKRSAGSDLTATQAVMGTPAYMAPEQASGSARFVGPQADVWSLGVILYEASTGTRPFDAEDVQGLLAQVMLAEPLPPRKRLASVSRDLELMCLKCLAKLPHERYPTAKELADDLDRFVRGEPISVRPAGPLERGYKWVKRNKVVSGAMAAVSLALVVSLGFGLEAQKQKTEAESAAEREKAEAARADRERDEAIAARNELKGKSDELKRALAKPLLGPITAKNRGNPLNPYEVEAFWRIAELRQDEAALTFLEEATRTPLACDQLECRAEYALHAAIGLNTRRRDAAEQLLLTHLRNDPQSAQSVALALVVARWENASPALAAVAADLLLGALSEKTDAKTRRELTESLSAVAVRLEPARATDFLLGALDKETDADTRRELVESLLTVARHLEPARAADILLGALDKETDTYARLKLARGLSAVSLHLEPGRAADVCGRAADLLLGKLREETNWGGRWQLAEGLSAVAVRLEPARAAAILLVALGKETDANAHRPLAQALSAVALRLEPTRAAEVCARAADILLGAMGKETGEYARRELAQSLSAVTLRLEPGRAADVCGRAADILLGALNKETNANTRRQLAEGLSAVAVRLEPARGADLLLGVLGEESGGYVRRELVAGLSAVALRLEPTRATELLLGALDKETDTYACWTLAQGLSAVAVRLEPAHAADVCARAADILLVLRKETNARQELARSLSAMALRLEPARGADLLLGTLDKETDTYARRELVAGLSAVAVRLDPARAAYILLGKLESETDADACWELAKGLAAVALRLKPPRAAVVCAEAANLLLSKLETSLEVRRELAEGLAAVALHLEPPRAAEVCVRAADFLLGTLGTKETKWGAGRELAPGLSAVALGVTSDDRERSQHASILATGAFSTPHNILPSLGLLHPHFQPQPRPLPPQTLVELLKHPFCVGEARRAVLDALEFTYKRPFKDQWEFVEYAQKHQPQLDLLTPPKRPEPRP